MTSLKRFCVVLLFFFSITISPAQTPVKWYKIEEAEQQAAQQKKKIMVKVYASWCGWCKEMDKATFPNKHVAKILNEAYIPVQFNSEQLQDITWGNAVYKVVRPKNSGRYHQLAAQWLKGQMSYPTIVILDEKGRVIQAIGGYRKAAEFEKIIAYFATNAHQNTSWANFEKTYKR